MDILELAQEHGWIVSIYPDKGRVVNHAITKRANSQSDIAITTMACAVLLGVIREEHPNADVADKASDLLLALQCYARTIR